MLRNILNRKRWISVFLITVALLAFVVGQTAACGDSVAPGAKPTPSPTIDPVQYQGSGISITFGAALLVLIVLFGVMFTLARQKQS